MKAILSSREMYSEKSVTSKSYFMRLISDVTDALAKLYILLKPGFCATVFDYWTSFSTAPSLNLLIILIRQCSSWAEFNNNLWTHFNQYHRISSLEFLVHTRRGIFPYI